MINGRDRFRDVIPTRDHAETQPSTSSERLVIVHSTSQVQIGVEQLVTKIPQIAENFPVDQQVQELPQDPEEIVEPQAPQGESVLTLKLSTQERRSAIPTDYIVYLQESDIRAENDPEIFSQAMSCKESNLWHNAMKDEKNSMKSNRVWDFVELPNGAK
ncbi:hypothetical protein TorRG33x02_175520, partial [Trema orientale]